MIKYLHIYIHVRTPPTKGKKWMYLGSGGTHYATEVMVRMRQLVR